MTSSHRRRWVGFVILCLAPGLRAAALPELLALQQISTTGQPQSVTIPTAPGRQSVVTPVVPVQAQPVARPSTAQAPGLETIIGGAGEQRPGGVAIEPAEPQEPQQVPPQQPPGPAPAGQPSGPVVTRLEVSGPGLMLLFDNAPLNTVVNLIMKELGYTYMVDPAVQGTVNIQTTQPVKKEDLFATLELILKVNNAAIVKAGDVYLIVPIGEGIRAPHDILLDLQRRTEAVSPAPAQGQFAPGAAAGAPATRVISAQGPTAGGDQRGLVTVIIPLQFIPSSEMTTIIQPFMSGGAVVLSYDSKNILILTDFRTNIDKVKRLIDILDTGFFDINNTELLTIRYNRAVEVASDLGKVFGAGGETSSITLIPIERLNSILVIAHSAQALEEVRRWVAKLDTASGGMNLQTFVYQVENSTAGNIADILVQLYSDGSGLPSQSTAEGQLLSQEAQPAAQRTQQPQQQTQNIRPQ